MTYGLIRAAVAAAGIFALSTAAAQAEYPEKAITIVVGTSAGGAADAGARLVGREMEKILGKPVVVVNKVGGGGTKALALLLKEKPDGYSLVYAFSHHITFGGQYKRKKPLFTATDFDYLGSITEPRQSLVSLAGRGWTTFRGMLKVLKAKKQPIRLVYSGGPGRLVGTALQKDLHYPVKVIRVRGGGKSMQRGRSCRHRVQGRGACQAHPGRQDYRACQRPRIAQPGFPGCADLEGAWRECLDDHVTGAGRPEGPAEGSEGQADRRGDSDFRQP